MTRSCLQASKSIHQTTWGGRVCMPQLRAGESVGLADLDLACWMACKICAGVCSLFKNVFQNCKKSNKKYLA